MRTTLLCLLLGGMPFALGCAAVGLREPTVTDSHVVSKSREPEVSWTPAVDSEGDGTMAHIAATKVCAASEREYRVVERTYSRERYNAEPKKDYSILFWGGVLVGLGVFMLADADNLGSNGNGSGSSSTPGDYQGTGAALAAVGGALALIPMIDALRAQGSEDEIRTAREKGEIVRRDLPCQDKPVPDALVVFTVGGTRVEAGRTGADGKLDVDLAKLLPAEAVLQDPDGKIDVRVGDTRAEPLSVEPLRAALDDQLWVGVDVAGCATDLRPAACQTVSRYLQLMPNGRHVVEARATADQAEAKLQEHARAQLAVEAARQAEERRKEAAAAAAQAQVEAAQKARAACRTQCSAACNGVVTCTSQCVAAKCH